MLQFMVNMTPKLASFIIESNCESRRVPELNVAIPCVAFWWRAEAFLIHKSRAIKAIINHEIMPRFAGEGTMFLNLKEWDTAGLIGAYKKSWIL